MQLLNVAENRTVYGKAWATREDILATSAVYHTPIGPIAIDLNYYDKEEVSWKRGYGVSILPQRYCKCKRV